MFVSVPVMRFAALVRRHKSATVPLMTDERSYHQVAGALRDVLARHGAVLQRGRPGWWVSAPMRLLLWSGGAAFRSYVPRELEHFTSTDLVFSLYPSGLLLRGDPRTVVVAHAIIAEAIIETDGLETTDPRAQELEREIRGLWKGHVLAAQRGWPASPPRIAQLAYDLAGLELDFEQWRAVYRQILQLDRALRGNRQLMEGEPDPLHPQFVDEGPTLHDVARTRAALSSEPWSTAE
jgi:hypothetical protein